MTTPDLTAAAREALVQRLREHAAIHDDNSSWDRDSAMWAGDLRLAAAALAAQQVGPPGGWRDHVERAWLVEWRFNGLQWLYLWPRAAGGFSFTGDANRALRFARREDAEAALQWARETDSRRGAGRASGELLVTEHEWPPVERAAETTSDGAIYSAVSKRANPEWHAGFAAGLATGSAAAQAAPVAGEPVAWPDVVRLVNEYAMHMTEAAMHEAESRADISRTAALKTIGELRATLYAAPPAPAPAVSFQQRVQPWLLECFGAGIAGDKIERNHRHLEESLELVQACGCTSAEAHQLVDYVFSRPAGEPSQEVGGVMMTLAALCLANGLDMQAAGEVELARVWTKVEQIRAKQAAKPRNSPLPEAAPAPVPPMLDDGTILCAATDMFPRWREDIQPQFVLRLSRAVEAAVRRQFGA